MNGCFGNVKGYACKLMREKKKKIASVKPKVYWSHVLSRDEWTVVKIQTL